MCGDERGFVAILNPKFSEQALQIAKNKIEKIVINTRLFVRGIYKGKIISLYKNGKITIKDIDNKEIAKKFFEELLS